MRFYKSMGKKQKQLHNYYISLASLVIKECLYLRASTRPKRFNIMYNNDQHF